MLGLALPIQAEEYAAPVSIQKDATQQSETLSERFSDFEISLGTERYRLPESVSEWEKNGWSYVEEEAVLLPAGSAKSGIVLERGEERIFVSVENQQTDRKGILSGSVIGISLDVLGQDAVTVQAELPGGVILGKSSMEEIEQIYGLPADIYEGETYTQLTYRYGMQSYLRLDLDKETKTLQGFEMENGYKRETSARAATPAQAFGEASGAQDALGEEIASGNVLFDSQLYRLPASLSDFVRAGFSIVPEESDREVAAFGSGFAVLQKDSRSVKVRVKNETDQTRELEACKVVALESSVYQDGFSMVLPGDIEIGMTQEKLEDALRETEMEKEESEHFVCYGIPIAGQTLDEISIFVEKESGLVVKIQIEKEA